MDQVQDVGGQAPPLAQRQHLHHHFPAVLVRQQVLQRPLPAKTQVEMLLAEGTTQLLSLDSGSGRSAAAPLLHSST